LLQSLPFGQMQLLVMPKGEFHEYRVEKLRHSIEEGSGAQCVRYNHNCKGFQAARLFGDGEATAGTNDASPSATLSKQRAPLE